MPPALPPCAGSRNYATHMSETEDADKRDHAPHSHSDAHERSDDDDDSKDDHKKKKHDDEEEEDEQDDEHKDKKKKTKKKNKDDKDEDDEDKEDDDDEEEDDEKDKDKGPPVYKRPAFIITVVVILLIAIVGGIIFWLYARHYVSTTDAYIDGHVMQIAPQVSARVIGLDIDDNQLVRKGELMVELDPTDFNVALEQAQAQLFSAEGHLVQSKAQVESARAQVTEAAAQIDAAQVELDNATRDLHRFETVEEGARTREQLDNARARQKNAQAQLTQAQARKASATASVNTSLAAIKASEGDVKTAQAGIKRAQVNLGYCRVYAPNDGRVTQRTVETGNYVQTGDAMFMLVSPDVWISANFKETKLEHMRPGQPVTIKVDAFPKMKLRGHVESIQAGSGARFSVLPPENATGNFVKIVQRVPVKILIDMGPNTNDYNLLSPGLSVETKVKVR